MTIKAGKLRHRVEIQYPVGEAFDGRGLRLAPGWRLLATVWAAVEPLSARDSILAEQTASKVVARITMRRRTDVDATMRILHGTTIYNIVGILPDKDSGLEYMTLPVTAGTNRG